MSTVSEPIACGSLETDSHCTSPLGRTQSLALSPLEQSSCNLRLPPEGALSGEYFGWPWSCILIESGQPRVLLVLLYFAFSSLVYLPCDLWNYANVGNFLLYVTSSYLNWNPIQRMFICRHTLDSSNIRAGRSAAAALALSCGNVWKSPRQGERKKAANMISIPWPFLLPSTWCSSLMRSKTSHFLFSPWQVKQKH